MKLLNILQGVFNKYYGKSLLLEIFNA